MILALSSGESSGNKTKVVSSTALTTDSWSIVTLHPFARDGQHHETPRLLCCEGLFWAGGTGVRPGAPKETISRVSRSPLVREPVPRPPRTESPPGVLSDEALWAGGHRSAPGTTQRDNITSLCSCHWMSRGFFDRTVA